ncbi:MAG TPA: hypothetical protein VKB09_06800, partial [Thermomicrobiales bacterium]|nr:hypothetical protein [Thermomicrobiales bacterium]
MPQCEQNGGRWRGQRGDWDFERGRGQWRGPREESFWHTPGTEYATASTGDEDWRFGYRGNPGGYGRWEDAPDWSGGPGFEGDFGRGRFGYGEPYGRNDIYGGMPGGYGGRGMASRGYRSDYGEGRWGPGMTDEFGPGRFRAGPGGYGRPDQFGRFGGRPWTGEGSFFGRGPRGYQRSDERIREDVCEVLIGPLGRRRQRHRRGSPGRRSHAHRERRQPRPEAPGRGCHRKRSR